MKNKTGLESLVQPRSVVVIGASDDPQKVGGRPIHYMNAHGYAGHVFPVNPHRKVIQGMPAYARLQDLPQVPDVAILAVSSSDVQAMVDDCAAFGVPAVIVLSSGFGETGPAGADLQTRMVTRAREAGMRIVGPNSQGLANFATGAIANFSTLFSQVDAADGPVAIIGQSGALTQMVYSMLRRNGIGVRYVHATGNEADVCVAELALHVLGDLNIRLMLLYLETVNHPELLARAAAMARTRGVQILVLKSGRTSAGREAAATHTGALSTNDKIFDAFCIAHGIWRANTVEDLVNTAPLYLAGRPMSGRRLGVLSNSGASCVIAADLADDAGLSVARLNLQSSEKLAAVLPAFASAQNPIDLTGALLGRSTLVGAALQAIENDPGVDALLVALSVTGPGYDAAMFARYCANYVERSHRPLVLSSVHADVRAAFASSGLATFASDRAAIEALAAFAGHGERVRRADAHPDFEHFAPGSDERVALDVTELLDEWTSLEWAEQSRLPVVARMVCANAEDAVRALARFDGPIVLKGVSPEAPHKSELGLVVVGLRNPVETQEAFDHLAASLATKKLKNSRIVAARHEGPGIEVVVGASWVPGYGVVCVVGAGGKLVELIDDIAVIVDPRSESSVVDALAPLRLWRMLNGVRGDPSSDVDALVRLVLDLAQVVRRDGGAIVAVDLNPVIVRPNGGGVVIVDALVQRLSSSKGSA